MAITSLANGTGKIYQVKPGGAIDTIPNTEAAVRQLLLEAIKSRIIYEAQGGSTENFFDPNYGSQFYLNDSGSAPVGSIVGAENITNYLILDTKNNVQAATIIDEGIEATRYSRITLIGVQPEGVATTATLNTLDGDFLKADIIVIMPREGDDEDNLVITIQDESVDDGVFRCRNNENIVLQGPGAVAVFIKGQDLWKEICRPAEQLLTYATKTLTPSGGFYAILDVSTPAAERISSKRGIVKLIGGATLEGVWTITGETTDTSISHGTTIDVIMEGAINFTSIDGGLIIFGITIPNIYCQNANFMVRAWYNDDDEQWEARMLVDELEETWRPLLNTLGSGDDDGIFDDNGVADASTSSAVAIRTISHVAGTQGMVNFGGYIVMDVNLAIGGGGVVVGDNQIEWWKTLTDRYFICPHIKIDGEQGACIVLVTNAGDLYVYPVTMDIEIGDKVHLDSVKYLAEA